MGGHSVDLIVRSRFSGITNLGLRIAFSSTIQQGAEVSDGKVQLNCSSDTSSVQLEYLPGVPFVSTGDAQNGYYFYGGNNDGYWCDDTDKPRLR